LTVELPKKLLKGIAEIELFRRRLKRFHVGRRDAHHRGFDLAATRANESCKWRTGPSTGTGSAFLPCADGRQKSDNSRLPRRSVTQNTEPATR
jgi:hypothetical protein